jgi:hypothetical protein
VRPDKKKKISAAGITRAQTKKIFLFQLKDIK